MKAAICKRYGGPEQLEIREVPKPVCKDNEIEVRIMATSVNSGDVKLRSLAVSGFQKIIMKIIFGFYKPRRSILGTVFAGIVEETGNKTTRFKKGDQVFGMTGFRFGTYAEYITLKETGIVTRMPVNASFEEAAALPFGWHTAIYFLEKAGIRKYQNLNVLIYGSTGSVGSAAIQVASFYGATVTAVCSIAGQDLMEQLNVEKVVYYDQQEFTLLNEKFDIILDAVGYTTKKSCQPLLKKGGNFVTVNGMDMATEKLEHLQLIGDLFEKGQCKAVIDKVFPFNEIVAAHRYVDAGRKKGNVVVTIGDLPR
ncbi:MAG: NAD(P)-dependent alcohol dehydrogenase [Flavihumibacter sp.]|nr:NAD(P)-dependent alcohol dehydrogenase [Flavihumibacter sp.]